MSERGGTDAGFAARRLNFLGWGLIGVAVFVAASPFLLFVSRTGWLILPVASVAIAGGAAVPGYLSHRRDPEAEGLSVVLSAIGAAIVLGFYAFFTLAMTLASHPV